MLKDPRITATYYPSEHPLRDVVAVGIENLSTLSGTWLEYRVVAVSHDAASDGTQLYGVESYTYDSKISIDVPVGLFYNVQTCSINVYARTRYTYTEITESSTVSELCESTKSQRYSGVVSVSPDCTYAYLKAFCNFSGDAFKDTYMLWESSEDGVHWEDFNPVFGGNVDTLDNVAVLDTSIEIKSDLTESEKPWVARRLCKVSATSPTDTLDSRVDILRIPHSKSGKTSLDNTLYRCSMYTVKDIPTGADKTNYANCSKMVDITLGMSMFTPVFDNVPEILVSDIFGVSDCTALYYGHVLYGFKNKMFKNYLIPTAVGETVRPMSSVLPLDTLSDAYVTAIVPWKEYLIVFTDRSVHLVSRISSDYTASTINSYIGVPETDYRCCVATLNGVIFKSGDHLYMLYPNLYAGSNTVLNLTDLSNPISTYLTEYVPNSTYTPFAISTHEEYVLMLPEESTTKCLRYNYSTKVWTFHTYPVVFINCNVRSISDVRLYGYIATDSHPVFGEYKFDGDFAKLSDMLYDNVPQADVLTPIDDLASLVTAELNPWEFLSSNGHLKAICFEIDSGQKTDVLGVFKQFVESKFNIATLHEQDTFPMQVTVCVDGAPAATTTHVSTDAAFWRTSPEQVFTMNTSLDIPDADTFNVFRQMYLRYSHKGKSVRHIVSGESLYSFKIYDINYRYRNLNIKS